VAAVRVDYPRRYTGLASVIRVVIVEAFSGDDVRRGSLLPVSFGLRTGGNVSFAKTTLSAQGAAAAKALSTIV
jgi:hypothetical protein